MTERERWFPMLGSSTAESGAKDVRLVKYFVSEKRGEIECQLVEEKKREMKKKDERTEKRDSEKQKARVSKNTKFQSQARMFLMAGYVLVAVCVKEGFIHTFRS